MRIREDKNVAKYVERIKASINAIKASRGEIKEEIVERKFLRTLLHIYAIMQLEYLLVKKRGVNQITR